ncbi:MAG: penicillin-binding protein 2, partial [Pseudomonadota bacterium]
MNNLIQRDIEGKKLLEQTRIRLFCIAAFFLLSFIAIGLRLVEITLQRNPESEVASVIPASEDNDPETVAVNNIRNDIVDRNGLVIASTLATESLFANPHDISNPEDATAKICKTFPELDKKDVLKKLKKDNSFAWIKRNLTPKEQHAANNLGIPGLYFQSEQKRIYPHGNLLSHLIGFVGLDNSGLAGVEKYFDNQLKDVQNHKEPLKLSIDLRVQNIVAEEIKQTMENFNAIGATGVVLDIKSGELVALANLP